MKKRIGAMESDSRPIRCRPTWRMPRAAWPRSAKRKKRWSRKPKSNWKHWRKSVRPPQKKGRRRKGEAESPIGDPQLRQRTKKQAQRARKRAACPTRQYNFVDPDSRVMKDGARKCFVQAYNAQAAVDAHQQVIVAAELTQEVNDSHQLLPMIQAAEQAAGQKAATITADAGYWDTIRCETRPWKESKCWWLPTGRRVPKMSPYRLAWRPTRNRKKCARCWPPKRGKRNMDCEKQRSNRSSGRSRKSEASVVYVSEVSREPPVNGNSSARPTTC